MHKLFPNETFLSLLHKAGNQLSIYGRLMSRGAIHILRIIFVIPAALYLALDYVLDLSTMAADLRSLAQTIRQVHSTPSPRKTLPRAPTRRQGFDRVERSLDSKHSPLK